MDSPELASYDVAEFDKSDPEAELRKKLPWLAAGAKDEDPYQGDILDKAAGASGKMLFMLLAADMTKMIRTGDLAGALDIVERAVARGMITSDEALFGKWMAYGTAGDAEAEMDTITKMEKAGISEISDEIKTGVLYRLGRRDELAAWCDAWSDPVSSRTNLYLNRARVMYLDGDAAGALKHVEAIILLDDHLIAGRELAGDILMNMGDLRGAVKRYNEALGIDFNDEAIHVKKAKTLMKMGRPDAAALACRRGLETLPKNKRLNDMLAETGR